MDLPISIVLAELFMQKLEEEIFLNTPYQPIFWKRYLDDIITVLPRDLIHVFLDYINSVNEHITFTVETETNNFLPYLDLNLIRKEDGHLMFDVYRKPTNHNNYLKYDSYHATQTKRTVVKFLTDRAKNLCSIEVVESEKSKVQEILKSNGYNQNLKGPTREFRKLYLSITLDWPVSQVILFNANWTMQNKEDLLQKQQQLFTK